MCEADLAADAEADEGDGVIRLSDPIGNFLNGFLAKAVLEAFQDFFPAVADDLGQPYAAVNVYEEGAFVQIGRLGVGGDGGVDGRVPHFYELGVVAAGLEVHIRHELGEDVGGAFGGGLPGNFQRRDIHATPLGQNPGAGGISARCARRCASWRRSHG